MSAGFKERSQRVLAMLQRSDARFLLVCAPEPASLAEVDRFFARLKADGVQVGGVIVNRVHEAESMFDESSYSLAPGDADLLSTLPQLRGDGPELSTRLATAYREQLTLAALDRTAIEASDWARSAVPVRCVAHFDRDLHSLADIAAFSAGLRRSGHETTATAPT
jgi:anion-transporting  ArsA/GET3 family ATPase